LSEGQRSLAEAWRTIDRLEADRNSYVRKDVYTAERDADRARIKRLEDDDTSKSTGTRTWLLGLVQMVLAVVLGAAAAYLTAKGGGR
jgi:hypothetical protein